MEMKNISFIIIAQNEEYGINKCLSSIKRLRVSYAWI